MYFVVEFGEADPERCRNGTLQFIAFLLVLFAVYLQLKVLSRKSLHEIPRDLLTEPVPSIQIQSQ